MFGDRIRRVDGTNTKELLLRRQLFQSGVLQRKQFPVEADTLLCAKRLVGLFSPRGLQLLTAGM